MSVSKQIVKYVCVGAGGNAAVLGMYYIATFGLGMWPGHAFAMASSIGFLLSYTLQRLWAFQYAGKGLGAFLRYSVGYVASFVTQWLILLVGVEYLRFPHQWVVLFGLFIAAVGFFLLQRYWVFASDRQSVCSASTGTKAGLL
jgi:putative flippase GtrA